MEDSTVDGLAGAGALLASASLAMPWYTVHVDKQLPGVSLGSASGWETLGAWRWAILALALVAGLKAAGQWRGFAALGLLVVVGIHWQAPPEPGALIAGQLPAGSDPLAASFAQGVIKTFTDQIGLELQPAVGMALAAAGAGAALIALLSRSRARAPA